MVAALGVLVLGLTPDPSRNYNGALDELIALRTIQQQLLDLEYASYLRRYVQPSENEKDFILDIARKTGTDVPTNIEVREPFASDFAVAGDRLMDYDAFFGAVHKIARLELVQDKTLTGVRLEFLKHQLAIQNSSHLSLSFTGVGFGGQGMSQLRDGTPVVDWRNLPADPPMRGQLGFKFADVLNTPNPQIEVPVPVAYSWGKIQKDRFALDWLRSSTGGKRLLDSKSDTVFPKLKKLGFWNGLSLMDVESARSDLQKKLDSVNTETVSFFGISVSKTVALWVGPLVCLMIEWLILLHFKELSTHVTEEETAKDCPWIASYPGRLSGLTTYSSLFVAPAANLVLLLFYGHVGERSTRFGAAFTLAMAVVAIWIVRHVFLFRSRVASQ
jgi:hypothetical protein